MAERTTIAIYLPDFSGGGVERQKIQLMDFFLAHNFSVIVIVHCAIGELRDALPQGVTVVDLRVSRTLSALPKLISWLRRVRPHVLLSSMGHNNIIAVWARFLARVSTKVIISQHNALSSESMGRKEWQYKVLPLLYRIFGRLADGIIAVSHGVAGDLSRVSHIPLTEITVIYNPVITKRFELEAEEKVSHRWLDDKRLKVFVFAGRLVSQKDVSTLLSAFGQLETPYDVRLIVLGDGPQRSELEEMAVKLGIADRVEFLGYRPNPLPYIRNACAFVLSSRYEGFGNVLVEALGCGTPVVSTNCPFGPSEILDDGQFGILTEVANPGALARAMGQILNRSFSPALLRSRASEFTVDLIGNKYLDLIAAVLRQPREQHAGGDAAASEQCR